MRIDSIILTEGSDIINLTVASGPTFPSNPSTSELFYKTTSAVGLYYYDGATWNRIGSSDELVAHATSSSLHLTSTQNAFLDAITVSSAEVNFLSGVTADIQGQLNDKLARDGDTINNTTIGATLAASGRFTTAKFNGTTYNPYVVAFGPGSHVGWTDPTDTGIGPYMASDGSDWRLIAGGSERLKITSGGAGIFTGPMEISGALTLGGPPTANLHAATKQYVDDGLAGVSGSVTLTGDVTGSGTGTIITTLTNTGVTASTYKSVTVDAKGRVTAGTNPTTLNGFGITDGVQNAGTVPSVSSGVFSGRPTAGTTGRIYYSTDTLATYRDNGTTWDLMIPALTGDITASAGSVSTALSTTGVSAGTYNSVTVDTKGRVTAASNVSVSGNPNYLLNNQVGYLVTESMAASSFSVAAGHRAIVRSIHVTNITAASANLAAEIRYGGTTSVSIAANMPIPAGTSVELFERPHVLNPSDQLRFQSSVANALHVTITWEDNTATSYFGAGAALTTTAMTDMFTSTGITSVVESILLVNYDTNVNNDTVTVVWTDGSNNIQGYLCSDMIVPVGGTIELLQNPKFLASGYKIRASTPVANRAAVHVSGKTL